MCSEMLFNMELERNFKICPKCQHYLPLSAEERIKLIVDTESYAPYVLDAPPEGAHAKTLRAGDACIAKHPVVVYVSAAVSSDASETLFLLATQRALEQHAPLIAVFASCQPTQALHLQVIHRIQQLATHIIPYLVLLTDPLPGRGYMTDFPMGDVILAEPFSEPLPVEQKSNQPSAMAGGGGDRGSTASHLMIDKFVDRKELPGVLGTLIAFFSRERL